MGTTGLRGVQAEGIAFKEGKGVERKKLEGLGKDELTGGRGGGAGMTVLVEHLHRGTGDGVTDTREGFGPCLPDRLLDQVGVDGLHVCEAEDTRDGSGGGELEVVHADHPTPGARLGVEEGELDVDLGIFLDPFAIVLEFGNEGMVGVQGGQLEFFRRVDDAGGKILLERKTDGGSYL